MLDLTHEPDLGFVFYPHDSSDLLGHPRLDVIISATPTNRHFDPEKAQFQVVAPNNNIEHLSITHPWSLMKKYRVCAGRIFLTDRKRKCVEAFSFGGDLQILSDPDHTVCALRSDAPIFPLFTTQDLYIWITDEVEILMARQKAHWDPQHPYDFEMHLTTLDPFLLYASCLQALQDRSSHIYSGMQELDRKGKHFVQNEIQHLQKTGKWPIQLPALDQLFAHAVTENIT